MAISGWLGRRRRHDGGWMIRRLFFRRITRTILIIAALMAVFPPFFLHLRLRRLHRLLARRCDWLNRPPLVCAHGGDSAFTSPNTMDAFNHALRSQVDCIEVDVSRSSDGVLFALHRRDLQRITRNSSIHVGHLSSKQIKEVDVSHLSPGKLRRHPIPTLQDALALISNSLRLVILDAKVGPPANEKGLAPDLLSAIERSKCKNCMVWAKSDTLARDIIKLASDVTVGYIVMVDPSTGARNNLLRMKGAKVVGVYHPLIDEKLMRVVHGRNKKVYAWTVDDVDQMKRMLHLGVDAIVTSHPAMLQGLMQDLRTECLEEGFSIRR